MLEQWILPGFVNWGEKTGIWDQYTFSTNCAKMHICNDLKVSEEGRTDGGDEDSDWLTDLERLFEFIVSE